MPSRNGFSVSTLAAPDPKLESNLQFLQVPGRSPWMPDGVPLFKPPYSRLTAIDMNTGDSRWMVPAGRGERIRALAHLMGLDLPALGGDSTFSGPLLYEDGALLRAHDRRHDRRTAPRRIGQSLGVANSGSTDLPGAAISPPMTYQIGGRQGIALTVQGSGRGAVPELVALSLP